MFLCLYDGINRLRISQICQNLDTIAGHAEKLNKIMKKTDRVEEIVELIAFELWSHDIVSPLSPFPLMLHSSSLFNKLQRG
jgi:hypothetical protein